MGAYWRRSGLESESPLASLPATGLSQPPPPRQPLWKQELNRKLEGYRDRQKLGESERVALAPEALQVQSAENRSEPAPGRMAAAAGAGAAPKKSPSGFHAVSPAGPKPKVEANWRRVSTPAESPKLPPLPKGTEAMLGTKPPIRTEAPSRKSLSATPAPSPAREVSTTAPIAPLAIRAVAGVLDFAIIVVAVGVFLGVFYMMGGVALTDLDGLRSISAAFLAIVCFYWIFYVGYLGGTSGMNWLGLRVLNFDGEPPTSAQRRTRALGTILSTLSLGLGFAWSIADEEKLTWHDRMSKTFVTRDGTLGFRARTPQTGPGKRLPELRGATRA
jgi:uncharacterized RDD family membrane protein YckC